MSIASPKFTSNDPPAFHPLLTHFQSHPLMLMNETKINLGESEIHSFEKKSRSFIENLNSKVVHPGNQELVISPHSTTIHVKDHFISSS